MMWAFQADDARLADGVRAAFATYLRARAGDVPELLNAEIAFGELVANVVQHAHGPIAVRVDWSGTNPVLHIFDRGPGFHETPHLPTDALSEHGRGLFLVQTLTEGLTVRRRARGGSHVSVVLPLKRPSDAHAGVQFAGLAG